MTRAPQNMNDDEAELDELFDLLELSDEWLTGFFASLFVGPDLVTPSAWLPVVMNGHAFADEDEAQWGLDILRSFYTSVGELIRDVPEKICPPPDDLHAITYFCDGFMDGSRLHPSWKGDDEGLLHLFIFDVLAGNVDAADLRGFDEKPMADPEAWRQGHREKLTEHFEAIRTYWADKRGKATNRSLRVKVGRNDPCPCGSGKKHKKCCLRS
jgi:uncharacterized protein